MNLVFLHSNGFSAPVYQGFFNALVPYKVEYPPSVLGHGNDFPKRSWKPMIKGVIHYLEQEVQTPTTLMGHSLGGVISLFVAAQRPDLLERVILLDPPTFGPRLRNILKVGKAIGISGRVPPASLAKRRRSEFESREGALEYFKGKKLFRNFDEQSLENYVQHGLKEVSGGGFQ
ncbi:MAG: alpha/beta hydrolase, partial [Bacteroidota bacterium]